ncbi:hypothetical protein J4402_00450 [Candidatus Pacearchaeota archaeon]|nr:hypothetical protein [Candidatus Pacearchaeota archaeon]
MNVITVPFFRDRNLRIESYNSAYVLQSAVDIFYSEGNQKGDEDVKPVERKVEMIAEISDDKLDLTG